MLEGKKRFLVLVTFIFGVSLSFSCVKLDNSEPFVKPVWPINPSWTLPVLEINTENGDSILSKDIYIPGICTFYSKEGYKEEEIELSIKGRGNVTWRNFEKKPYKIKFGKKYQLPGGGKSKHFALLCFAESGRSFWGNLVGFEISKRIGLEWTPSMKPYELILNGDYQGIYFLTENIRVEKDRVNIAEQKNGEEDLKKLSGGWLLEIDNYEEANQICVKDRDGKVIRFTYHSPDSLSNSQYKWLKKYLNDVNDLTQTYDLNDTRWEDYIDINELAKFYIVQEIMENPEAFCGSCWLHKDIGENSKIKFGPVWDFGECYYFRDEPDFLKEVCVQGYRYKQSWLTELLEFEHFQNTILKIWSSIKDITNIDSLMNTALNNMQEAIILDHQRWPQYDYTFTEESKQWFLEKYYAKVRFLHKHWDNLPTSIDIVPNSSYIVEEEGVYLLHYCYKGKEIVNKIVINNN